MNRKGKKKTDFDEILFYFIEISKYAQHHIETKQKPRKNGGKRKKEIEIY